MPGQQRAAADRHRAEPVDDAPGHIGGHVDRRGRGARRHRHHQDAGHQEVDVRYALRRVTEPMADRTAEDVVEQQQHHDRDQDRADEQQPEQPEGVLELAPEHCRGVVGGDG